MTATAIPKPTLSKADNAREHELYRYFKPPEPSTTTLSAHEASSPNTVLTALAQLCAHRLHAKRAMISVIDRENQYFIAESTKTLDLVDNNKSEVEGDGLWFGCGTVDKAGRLCEKTIELRVPHPQGRHPCFTVNDLSKDERFNQLPFVAGEPYFKFYAGTPITTKKGINIGSLFVIDDAVRDNLCADQEMFLSTMAQTVMHHMEMTSDAEERKKVMRLSLGMNSFVEGKGRLSPEEKGQDISILCRKSAKGTENPKKRSESESKSLRGSPTKDAALPARQRRAENPKSASEPDTSQDDSDSGNSNMNVETGHSSVFKRAAKILCDSLDLTDSGGVVYFDTTSRLRHSERESQKPAEVISYSPHKDEVGLGDQSGKPNNNQSFSPVDENLLFSLLSRYQRGKMWTFDQDGNLSSSEEDTAASRSSGNGSNPQSQVNRRQVEAMLLQKHFPGVRQIIFSGLWDAALSRSFAAGFAWTTSSRQIFTRETELSYFLAFGNSLMAEVSRLASIQADRQKADFIGSISHEFRSPLHGILASAEFLAETDADGFQNSLIDTISSCGRTLLDTINHILDYSKINSFERNWRNVRKPGRRSRRIKHKEVPPMMSIYSTIDVAAVTEEVVEGVYAGQIYQDISSTDPTGFSTAGKAEAMDRGIPIKKAGKAKEVDVHIDIEFADYTFTTQPGALKRIILNVFGNALKYTVSGLINVHLSLEPVDDTTEGPMDERMLKFKVTDTGKGISSEYLRTSLFNPFCQEDPLASGTGLGLSIVKSIVTMLKGTIDVESELGKGTEVTIRLPLTRLPGTATPVSTPSSVATDTYVDDSVTALKASYVDSTVALLGFGEKGQAPVLRSCVEHWYGLRTVSLSAYDPKVDVCVVDEKELAHMFQDGHTVPTVVLCSNATRSHGASRHHVSHTTEFISKPVGPYKLAKALRSCLDRAKHCKPGLPIINIPDEESPMDSEADTVIPDLGLTHLTLEDTPVWTNGVITASETENAQMAIDSSSGTSGEVTVTEGQAFPFPTQDNDNGDSEERDVKQNGLQTDKFADEFREERNQYRADLTRRDSRRPALVSRMTEPWGKTAFLHTSNRYDEGLTFSVRPPNEFGSEQADVSHDTSKSTISNLTASNIALHNGEAPAAVTPPKPEKEKEKRPPRLLLVDDNKINLRLLETYMRKRKYKLVDSAEDGQLAVEAVEASDTGYDIIFMDISMPRLNGFQATRAIRDIEEARPAKGKAPNPALIIALTGLASSRDQTEAFNSGVDLFMTKPVSFKEVGKLLENWEIHGGIKPLDGETTPQKKKSELP